MSKDALETIKIELTADEVDLLWNFFLDAANRHALSEIKWSAKELERLQEAGHILNRKRL